jgi:hypothetical protein
VMAEVSQLLQAAPAIPFEVKVKDGSSLSVVPGIAVPLKVVGLPGHVEFDAGVELESARTLVRQRGTVVNGQPFVTEEYGADAYVARPGKNWTDLTVNALSGLLLLVRDAFNWVSEQVSAGAQWVVDVSAKAADGIEQAWARLTAPAGNQLQVLSASGVPERQVASVNVVAIGWVPSTGAQSGAASSLGVGAPIEAAAGEGFAIGGVFEFQPYTMTISPAASLVIGYTDAAVAGIDESKIGMFRWDVYQYSWQGVSAQADVAHNTFTAVITRLGTYALGYDDIAPRITVSSPADGSVFTNTLPLVSATVSDVGVGIDPATVKMKLDGQSVPAQYMRNTGELYYQPEHQLAIGGHMVEVSAADAVGNSAVVTARFTIAKPGSYSEIHLPIILR